jgi:hypothetical protein
LPGHDRRACSHWVKRSKKRSVHEECDQVAGITFGGGNEVSARLYDKTRELQTINAFDVRALQGTQVFDRRTSANAVVDVSGAHDRWPRAVHEGSRAAMQLIT